MNHGSDSSDEVEPVERTHPLPGRVLQFFLSPSIRLVHTRGTMPQFPAMALFGLMITALSGPCVATDG